MQVKSDSLTISPDSPVSGYATPNSRCATREKINSPVLATSYDSSDFHEINLKRVKTSESSLYKSPVVSCQIKNLTPKREPPKIIIDDCPIAKNNKNNNSQRKSFCCCVF